MSGVTLGSVKMTGGVWLWLLIPLLRCGEGVSYPAISPVCFLEEDAQKTVFERLTTAEQIKWQVALAVPLYVAPGSKNLYVSDPFIVSADGDVESGLSRAISRDTLERVIVIVPGYRPVAIPGAFRMEWEMGGRKKTIMEVSKDDQPVDNKYPSVEGMLALLGGESFKIGEAIGERETGTAFDVVRSVQYHGRYYFLEHPRLQYVLWGFNPGTVISVKIGEAGRRAMERLSTAGGTGGGK